MKHLLLQFTSSCRQAFLAFLLLFATELGATTYTFTGSGNWTNPANWDANGVAPFPIPIGSAVIIDGDCSFDLNDIQCFGSLVVNAGKTLTMGTHSMNFPNGTFINNGICLGGNFNVGGDDFHQGFGTNNGTMDVLSIGNNSAGVWTNTGTLTHSSTVTNFGIVNNSGTLNSNNDFTNRSTVTIQAGSTWNMNNSYVLLNHGTGVLAIDGVVNYAPVYVFWQNHGTITGTGTFAGSILNDSGAGCVFAPGHSPGLFTITGNFKPGNNANVVMEVNGTASAGTDYDKMVVGGTLMLEQGNGAQTLIVPVGYSPNNGDYATIFSTAALSGQFPHVTIPANWYVNYNLPAAGQITLSYGAPCGVEICNGVDDDCDGQVDEGVSQFTFYADTDGDGYGDANNTTLACSLPSGYVSDNTDCDDSNAAINPAATEICNGLDDDCDGLIDDADPGITSQPVWYADADNDGYGNANVSQLACNQPSGYVNNPNDCNDANSSIHPTATETCNGFDDDCDGETDEGLPIFTFYADADGDGYGDAASTVQNCSAPSGYVSDNTDCDDTNAAVNPGETEICNGLDDDCDGQIDEGVLLTFYADADGDGDGNATVTTQACTAPSGYVANNTDCNDSNAAVHPGAAEVCNNLDDDCDGLLNEGTPDGDGDGICNTIDNCPSTYNPDQADNEGDGIGDVCDNNDDNDPKLDHQDCAPFNPNVYPGATEICGNLIDDDCDNKIDEPLGLETLSEQDVLCYGQATGSITVTGTCGLPPYTYLWTNGATTATITGLVAGSYKVTLTDAQGLTKTKNHNITQPSALNVSMTKTDVSCFGGSDGKATANPSGGKSPYTYSWSNGGTTKTITGLTFGAYIVTVTDANGCTKVGGVEVNQPTQLIITNILVEPDPAHPGKYKITVTPSGGTPFDNGYRYRRCNPGGTGCTGWQISNVLTNVPAGNYLVRVKDKNDCEAEQPVTVGGSGKPVGGEAVLFENENIESPAAVTSAFEIRLYPNPASTEINVFVSGDAPGESLFEIADFTGKTLQRTNAQPTAGELTQFDLTGLPTGTYLLRWSAEGKTLAGKVFLLTRN